MISEIMCRSGFHEYSYSVEEDLFLSNYEVHKRVCRKCGKYQSRFGHVDSMWLESWEDQGTVEDFEEITCLMDQKNKRKEDNEQKATNRRTSRVWLHGEFKF